MGTNEKPVQLKVLIDKQKKKVIFAEAEQDFVDILFSFLTLPLGTIARLSLKHAGSKDIKIGSLTSLYESVVNLNAKHFNDQWYKDILIHPRNPSDSMCQKLKVNLNEETVASRQCDAVFVKSMARFIITDNLNVLPLMLDTSIEILNSHGVENINLLEERTMSFGLEEFLNLLKWSLLTNNPLTNLVLGGGKPCSSCITNSTFSTRLPSTSSGQKVNLLIQKSKGKVLCAEVERFFVEMLFGFLTIPLGTCIRLTKDGSSPSGIINLYNSISCLGDDKHLKSEDVKTMLLCPKLSDTYFRATDFLPIYGETKSSGHFLKEQPTFIVSNDLELRASSSIGTISNFNTLGVPVADMEVLEVAIGEHEALLLLKASLTSTSALTDCFSTFIKKSQVKSLT